jgi:hypothetical protein
MDNLQNQPLDTEHLRPARVAAIVNGLVVLLLPFALMALAQWAASSQLRNGATVTARVSSDFQYASRILVGIGKVVVWSTPFALVAGWRTWVHSRHRLEGRGSGWQGVAEGSALGFCTALLVLLPGIVTRPLDAPPYVAAYGGMAAVLGLLVGIVLRFTALVALRIAGREKEAGSP